MPTAPHLAEVHAGVQGDGGHGARVVVRHLDGPVPLAGVPVERQPQRCARQLVQRRDLLSRAKTGSNARQQLLQHRDACQSAHATLVFSMT